MNNKIFKALVALFMCISILPFNAVRAEDSPVSGVDSVEQTIENTVPQNTAEPTGTPVPEVSPEPTVIPETTPVPTVTPDADAEKGTENKSEPVVTTPVPSQQNTVQTLNEGNKPVVGLPDPNVHAITIGAFTFDTMDEAVAAALEMTEAEIVITEDVELTTGINMNGGKKINNLKITAPSDLDAKPVITFKNYGIALQQSGDRARTLGFENVDVVINDIKSTPFNEWSNYTICTSPKSTINLKNVKMTMNGNADGDDEKTGLEAIFMDKDSALNLTDSELMISNYKANALEWNGTVGAKYELNLTNSKYTSDANRSGIIGTFTVTATDSEINVINSTGNASNGSHFYLTRSIANFSNNGGHGISAGDLIAVDSTITTNDNRYYGMYASNTSFTDSKITSNNNGFNGLRNNAVARDGSDAFAMVNSDLELIGNGYTPGDVYAGMQLAKTVGTVDSESSLLIQNSANNGLRLADELTDLTIDDGAVVTITGNHSPATDGGKKVGGGIHLIGSKLRLPAGAAVYNNDAAETGADIYITSHNDVTGTLTFQPVGSDWVLDAANDGSSEENPTCNRLVDGWYLDGGVNPRWKAHGQFPLFVQKLDITEETVINQEMGIKAAHGLVPEQEPEKTEHEWQVSKSKEATKMNKKLETTVTLSLPATEQQVETDVVFVLDKSKSAELKAQAIALMEELNATIRNTQAKVNVGIVTFNRRANRTLELTELNDDNLPAIREAINATLKEGGTNLHAGVLEGKKMLDADTTVDASRKYLITVSDGITYMFNEEPTAVAWSFDADGWRTFASPDNWGSKYGNNNAPADWNQWLEEIGNLIRQNGDYYDYPYGGTVVNATPHNPDTYKTQYANSVDKALYLTYKAYTEAENAGYKCFALNPDATTNEELAWGPSFINFLADGEQLSFADIKNEIIYFLDAESSVVDYIGYTEEYNFDLIPGTFELTVNGVKLAGHEEEGNRISFGDDEYVVEYIPGNRMEEEHFVWYINVPVKVTEPVRLSYTLKLTNPQKEPGTYGEYDRFGTGNTNGLFTNNSAILYPVDSLGQRHEAEEFNRPSVSYVVLKKPVHGPDNPDIDPEVNPDPQPTPQPLPGVPNTGDDSNMMLWVILLIAAAGGAAYFFIRNKTK